MKRFSITLALLCVAGASAHAAPLPPGSNDVFLPGTSFAGQPVLVGPAVASATQPFQIFSGGGALLFQGELVQIVRRSNATNTLGFYYAIRNTVSGLNGVVARVEAEPFTGVAVDANWMTDSVGLAMPNFADRNGSGSIINYDFLTPPFFSGAESRIFLAFTDATEVNDDGFVTIYLTGGESVTLPAFAPGRPCPSCRGDVNGDGVVDFADLNEVLGAFGTVCPPPSVP
ncbi:MAG: hypothetical protein KF684_05725 [Phycisphaeraceae bacterium]|nr:hypothetical protein [Phycisphaeraceae bacterium]